MQNIWKQIILLLIILLIILIIIVVIFVTRSSQTIITITQIIERTFTFPTTIIYTTTEFYTQTVTTTITYTISTQEGIFYKNNKSMITIKNITLIPTKIINDKIYDLSIYFTIEGVVSNITVEFIPQTYYIHLPSLSEDIKTYIYKQVFPDENIRIYKLYPGSSRYVVNITDIKGGKGYIIKITAKGTYGNYYTKILYIPYIREFENIAKLDDILIATYYYVWYGLRRHWDAYLGTPLLGEYDSMDPIVICKHIDWATGHGIDVFIVSWWGPRTWEDAVLHALINSPCVTDIKFAILYESLGRLKVKNGTIDLDDEENIKILIEDFKYISKYFSYPQYLKIESRPLVVLYLARSFRGNVSRALYELRKSIRELGFEVYLVGDLVYWQDPITEIEHISLYDAVTAYNMHINNKNILDHFEEFLRIKYGEWFSMTRALGVGFIPSVLPGFDDKVVRSGNLPLPKSVERFRKQLELAKQYMDPKLKIIAITSFNEWHEYTYIEPSYEDGFDYLKIIKEFIKIT